MASLIRYINNKRKEKRESEDMKCEMELKVMLVVVVVARKRFQEEKGEKENLEYTDVNKHII